MSLTDNKELDYARGVARRWYRTYSAIDEPAAQKKAAEWEAVLLAESPEDVLKALNAIALGIVETNEQEGEADG